MATPLGETISTGSHEYDKFDTLEEATNSMPWRDGTHIRRDMVQLNLPGYVIAFGKSFPLEPILY